MTQHLTWEQISDYLIGGAASAQASHARDCGSCGSEIARIEAALGDFRGAVRSWTDRMSRIGVETEVVMNTGVGMQLDLRRGMYAGNETKAGLSSLAIHAAVVALLLFLGTFKPVQIMVNKAVTLIAPAPPLKVAENKGGGGGGARQPEVKKADLPKPAPRQFVAPRVDAVESKLEMPASIVADVPDLGSTNVGNISGLSALNGNGYAGGIGNGGGGGVGNGKGPGVGTGAGGGLGGGIYRPGGDVTAPVPIYRPEPQYSEEARKAKWQGVVTLSFVVDEMGKPFDIHVVRALGLGLDEKAIEAVRMWLFKPGLKSGKPVKVAAQVEVTFRLL